MNMKAVSALQRTAMTVGGATLLLSLAATAFAAPPGWTGPAAAVVSGGSPFSVSGATVTVTQAITPTKISINGAAAQQLVAIDGFWLVNSTGTTLTGVTPASALLSGPGAGAYTATTGPAGFNGDTWGNDAPHGTTPTGNFIQLADQAALTAAGKSFGGYTSGAFTFSSTPGTADFGIDYLLANGQTGRAFFATDGLLPPAGSPVPEPASFVTVGMGVFGLLGLMAVARRRQSQTA